MVVNQKIVQEISKNHLKDSSINLSKYTNRYIKKMTDNLSCFSYNVLIANLHEMYSYFNKELDNQYSKETIRENYNKILVTMIPIIPHFASECLMTMNWLNQNWPKYDEKLLLKKMENLLFNLMKKKKFQV